MKVAILGYDTEGKVSYDYYKALGAEITICDQKTDISLPEGAAGKLGEGYLQDLDRFDLLVRTAGLPPHLISEANPGVVSKTITAVNEFMRVCPTRNVIGVTGTKGKGTTSTLITKILAATGKDVHLGGNIGVSPLTFLSDLTPESWVVLELSSFQLIDLQRSPHIGVCLMVVPEHLNWHEDMDEYTGAKAQLFAHQNSDDIAIYFAANELSKEIAAAGAAHKLPFYESPGAFINGNLITIDGQEVCTTEELKLLGAHNRQNVCAAVTAVWQAGIRDIEAIRSVLTTFTGLEHRLQLVRGFEGVAYYDDSFGTTPETAIVAIDSFTQPKVLILGGSDKGARYDALARTVAAANIRKVVLIGSEGPKLQTALATAGFRNYTEVIQGRDRMAEIVEAAHAAAQDGDVVLLSTGCASFDMFENYKDRGRQFQEAVRELR
jgi:UDP-N-acetylmuramoylalanine--D-glutamate ligase